MIVYNLQLAIVLDIRSVIYLNDCSSRLAFHHSIKIQIKDSGAITTMKIYCIPAVIGLIKISCEHFIYPSDKSAFLIPRNCQLFHDIFIEFIVRFVHIKKSTARRFVQKTAERIFQLVKSGSFFGFHLPAIDYQLRNFITRIFGVLQSITSLKLTN